MRNLNSMRGALCGLALALSSGGAVAGDIDKQDFAQIERGRYLTIVGDCAACHTLPGSGHAYAGGRAIETPFGDILAPNITPDQQTGIGAWTDDEFVNAMQNGTGRNGKLLFPAMPYTYYTRVTREDVLAIRAYLNTVPAVQNAVNADQLPFPLNIRQSMIIWKRLFFRPGEFRANAGKSEEWNRGAYLAEGLGHCGLCHTPKNFLGGDETSRMLRGYALQGWFAADITDYARRGLGAWSNDDIATYLKTGRTPTSIATGLMAETISQSTSHMSDADLKAIATYLKDQPGQSADDNPSAGPVGSTGHENRRQDLRGRVLRVPCGERQGNPQFVPGAPRLGGRSTDRSHFTHACSATRLTRHRHRRGTDRCGDAGIWMAA